MRGVFSASVGDDLLRWASEAGSGGWERMRDVCSYLTAKHGLDRRPWTIAAQLSQLGHLDIDWESRSWSVAPPALNLVPGLGLCLVLTGSRPHHINDRFERATDDMDVYPFEVLQEDAPRAKFAKCSSIEIAQRTAERFGSRLVIDPAKQLVSVMRSIEEVPLVLAAPLVLDEAEYFDVTSLEWRSNHGGQPGLYRLDLHGRKEHRRLDQYGTWSKVDLPIGQFLELRANPMPVLKWRRPHGKEPSYLEVHGGVSLPLIAERAAVVSSGLVPRKVNEWRRYPNVPESIARSLAHRLMCMLSIC